MSALEYIDYCYNAFIEMSTDQQIPFVLGLIISIWIFSLFNSFIIWCFKRIFKKVN